MGFGKASIDMDVALESVKRINERLTAVNERCVKLAASLDEAAKATNITAITNISEAFESVKNNTATLASNMQSVYESTQKYVAQVEDIDEDDGAAYQD